MTVSRSTSVICHFKRDFTRSFEALGLVLVPLAFVIVTFSDFVFVVFHIQFGSITFWLDVLEITAASLYSLFFIVRAKTRFWRVILSVNAINMFTFVLGLYLAIAPTNEIALVLVVLRLAISLAIFLFVTKWWSKVRSESATEHV